MPSRNSTDWIPCCRLATLVLVACWGQALPSAGADEWRVMPIRSEEGFDLGMLGGEAEHPPHGIARCLNHPDVIYAGMMGNGIPCVFRNMNSGSTWQNITGDSAQTGSGALQVNPHTGELFRGTGRGTWVFPSPPGLSYSSSDLVHDKFFAYLIVLGQATDDSPRYGFYVTYFKSSITVTK